MKALVEEDESEAPTQAEVEAELQKVEIPQIEASEVNLARVAAVLLIPEFRRVAHILARFDPDFEEDLVQVMCLETLQAQDLHSMTFYANNARWKAIDVMRHRELEERELYGKRRTWCKSFTVK